MLMAMSIGTIGSARAAGARADLLIRPPVGGFSFTDVRVFDRVVEVGYRAAQQALAEARATRILTSRRAYLVLRSASSRSTARDSRRWLAPLAWLACAAFRAPRSRSTDAAGAKPAANRGVAALGRIEPLGGIVRVAAASTPDAVSGAVARQTARGPRQRRHGRPVARGDGHGADRQARIAEARADLETARRDATAAVERGGRSLRAGGCRGEAIEAQAGTARPRASPRARRPNSPRAMPMRASRRARRAARRPRSRSRASARSSAKLARHEAELERSFVRAPFAGRVIDVLRRPGETRRRRPASSNWRASTRCRRSPRCTRPTSATSGGPARARAQPGAGAGPRGHGRADPSEGAEDRPDRRRPGRAQGCAHRRGRDPARRQPRRRRTSPTCRWKSRSAAESAWSRLVPAAPLGWLQLWHKPLRLAVAVAGIAFAVLLILMQLGFRSALFESTLRFHERFRYDIALFSTDSVFIVRPAAFSIRRLYEALGSPDVASVSPVYIFPGDLEEPVEPRPAQHQRRRHRPDARRARHAWLRREPAQARGAGRRAVRPRLAARVRAGGGARGARTGRSRPRSTTAR